MKLTTILFDLDGVLLDTVFELTSTLNLLLEQDARPTVNVTAVRDVISQGSAAIIEKCVGIEKTDPEFQVWCDKFLAHYEKSIASQTKIFPGILEVIQKIEQQKMQWGVVTNRTNRHTFSLLDKLNLMPPNGCVVTAETLNIPKPAPEPLWHACDLLKTPPESCVFIGDAQTDVLAGNRAGMNTLIALYGYIPSNINPLSWGADGTIHSPLELLIWLKEHNSLYA